MKDYDLDRILLPAFKLFLTNNYEKVSTSLLEQETGLTRGAIYYKWRTKADIFKAVVDKYILEVQSSHIEAYSLIEYINKFLERMEIRMGKLLSLGTKNMHRAYFGLIYQALQYYPDFEKKIAALFEANRDEWEMIIQMAKDKGEIRQDCNTKNLAQKFRYIYSGLSFERSLSDGLKIEELKKLYYFFYNEIKYEK